uniref:Uncharacterized protein n=1 Tax=Eutreptiella gymnastica TaxID=73025 RepID=A0A7S4CUK1_9EUGL
MDDGAQHPFRRAHTTALTVGRGAVTCGHAAHERADDFVLSAPVSLGTGLCAGGAVTPAQRAPFGPPLPHTRERQSSKRQALSVPFIRFLGIVAECSAGRPPPDYVNPYPTAAAMPCCTPA